MKQRVFWGGLVLLAIVSALGWRLLGGPRPMAVEGASVVEDAARKTTALAAVFAAAALVADADELETLEEHVLVRPSEPWFEAIEERFPERRALIRAVERWPEARKRAALAWVLENTTWSTMLHAMAIESFDAQLQPREWGPSMSVYAPEIHARRASLAPLLQEALDDPAIRRIAQQVAVQREPFTAEGVQQRRDALVRYLRFEEELPEFHAFQAPLMSAGGVNAVLPDGSVLMVVGAPADASLTLTHEMAHQPVHRILSKPLSKAALAASECAFATVERNYGYSMWGAYFAESLVRSLSYRLEGREVPESDFPFERFLTEMLESWEGSSLDFEELVLVMLHQLRERTCGTDAPEPPMCPSPFVPLPSGTCLYLPADAGTDLPVAIYLHGMNEHPWIARKGGFEFAQAAGEGFAILVPLGTRGECAWSPELEKHHCWPVMPERDDALQALVKGFRAELEEVRRRLGRDEAIAPFLVGYSNGGFAAVRIAATTEFPLAGLAVIQAGAGPYSLAKRAALPTFLGAARGDPWHLTPMQTLREQLTAADWPVAWWEREGGHAETAADLKAVAEFILEASRKGRGASP